MSPGEPIGARELTNLIRGEFGLDVRIPGTIERALGVKNGVTGGGQLHYAMQSRRILRQSNTELLRTSHALLGTALRIRRCAPVLRSFCIAVCGPGFVPVSPSAAGNTSASVLPPVSFRSRTKFLRTTHGRPLARHNGLWPGSLNGGRHGARRAGFQRITAERGAYLYIRQSSMRQVIENVERTKRQPGSIRWPCHRPRVARRSGHRHRQRSGQIRRVRVVARRLPAPDVRCWHGDARGSLWAWKLSRASPETMPGLASAFLEICALADTLILDEDGVCDPANFNDRLLLGLKGTMSEAELHVIKARLRGGILNKVRRGEYRCVLPTGLTYDGLVRRRAGRSVPRIRETVARCRTFRRVGSASQTIKAFATDGLFFLSRLRNQKQVVFQPLTISTCSAHCNPRYAELRHGRRLLPSDDRVTAITT